MPLTFPAHQGLVSPLWQKWPDRFNLLALWVGAASPDGVDAIIGAYRGYLGQSLGHSLIGLFLFCVPLSMFAMWVIGTLGDRLREGSFHGNSGWTYLERMGQWIYWLDHPKSRGFPWIRMRIMFLSVWIGAFSHLLFDFFSHTRCLWLYPWFVPQHVFPTWWTVRWFELPLPGYKNPYPIGPHALVWILLNLLGILAFYRTCSRMDRQAVQDSAAKQNRKLG